mmetsp:Transcript_26056/g.29809  ORF Transcript_26056/g.29809 Transcript_26056/m.29809 type:complete len:316 (+) Transcript_26056:98-1045(+)
MPSLFTELITSKRNKHNSEERIEVITGMVEPKLCRQLLQDISKLKRNGEKDQALSHLKRVKRHQRRQQDNNISSENREEFEEEHHQVSLEVLLGRLGEEEISKNLVKSYNLRLKRKLVPARSPGSEKEVKEFNAIWPTIYFHKQSEEYKAVERKLSALEVEQMKYGIEQALKFKAAVIIDPVSGCIISKSKDELSLQEKKFKFSLEDRRSPNIYSPVILAIQGVSRLERKGATDLGMDSAGFYKGQYLCTGYDIYLEDEPDVFESMALLHSRIRRVVFASRNLRNGGIGGTGIQTNVNLLSGTNHHYRAFIYTGM